MALGWRDQYLRYREFYLNIQALYKQRADLRAFLEIILSISTVIIFLIFALKPTALTIISLYNEIQGKQKTVAALDQKINNLVTASGLFAQNQNFIPDVDASVANAPRPDLITQQIQALAVKDSVAVMGIAIGQVTLVGTSVTQQVADQIPLPDNAKEMDISVSIKGDYPNLDSFLKDFGNLRMVTKLDITGVNSSVTDKGTVITMVIAGRVPYLGH